MNENWYKQRSPVVSVRQSRLLLLMFSVPVSEPGDLSNWLLIQSPRPSRHLNQIKSNQ